MEGQDVDKKSSSTQEAYQENQQVFNFFVDLSQYEMILLHREDIKTKIVDVTIEEGVNSFEVSTNDDGGEWTIEIDIEDKFVLT